MRVLLVSANTERVNMLPLPLGLVCVATAARSAGHEVKFLDLMAVQGENPAASVRESIRTFNPQAIGISVRNIDNQDIASPVFFLEHVRDIVSECRRNSDAPVILGGAGYSIFPQSALDYLSADLGIRGEGEAAFIAVLENIHKSADVYGLPGIYVRGKNFSGTAESISDLNDLPLPDPRIAALCSPEAGEIWMPFQTRRGCPLRCSYCSTPFIEGCRLRKRRLKAVIKSLADHIDAGFRKFWFVDNTFNLPLGYSKELCRSIIDSGLKMEWRCIIHPSHMDKELADLLARANCVEAALGFESGSEAILARMNKNFRPRDVAAVSGMLRSAGIRRAGFLMLGSPGETRETVRESLAFADGLDLDFLKITVGIRIYPETALAGTAVEDGLVPADDDLLMPRFYLVPGLEAWLRETLRSWMADRPGWSF